MRLTVDLTDLDVSAGNAFRKPEGQQAPLEASMLQEGALGALMSGSGPSVFAICTDEEIAGKVEKSWLRESIKVLKLKTISRAYQMIDFGEEYAG